MTASFGTTSTVDTVTAAGLYPKCNFTALVPPGPNDDDAAGYSVGSQWLDQAGSAAYICLSAATGAAVWGPSTSSLPLDGFPVSLVEMCVFARLRSSYGGPLLEVRRSSDNALTDIGYGANNLLDTAALLTFCGAGDGFVRTVYDQSGNGNDYPQLVDGDQPQIVSAGTVNELVAGVPTMNFAASALARADALGLVGDQAVSIAYTGLWDAGADFTVMVGLGGIGDLTNHNLHIRREDPYVQEFTVFDGSRSYVPNPAVTTAHYGILRHAQAGRIDEIELYTNGNVLAEGAVAGGATVLDFIDAAATWGSFVDGVAKLTGQSGLLIVANSYWSDTQRNTLAAFLAAYV